MNPEDDQQGTHAHSSDSASGGEVSSGDPDVPASQYEDSYPSHVEGMKEAPPPPTAVSGSSGNTPPPAPPAPPGGGGGDGDGGDEDGDADEDGMLRMSFLEHLEELRTRIIRALMGLAAAFVVCVVFANELWEFVSAPAMGALHQLGFQEKLWQHTPMETFSIVWVKIPLLASVFVAAPWILYQVWAFIAPGLYKRERRWAGPFVISTAGLFILGGVFAYFVAFRYGLTFLLGIGRDIHIAPVVSVTEYTDLFVNVMLGVGLVFELPILIFFLTLLRIVTPSFLLNHSRYAILIIVIVAAIVTPTPDVFNLMLFAVPMCLLFYVGIFAGYILVLRRENRRFPWMILLMILAILAVLFAAGVFVGMHWFGVKVIPHWPFLTR